MIDSTYFFQNIFQDPSISNPYTSPRKECQRDEKKEHGYKCVCPTDKIGKDCEDASMQLLLKCTSKIACIS